MKLATTRHPLDLNPAILANVLRGEDTPRKLAFIDDMLPLAIKTFREEDFSLATMNAEEIINAKFRSDPEATAEGVLQQYYPSGVQAA